MERNDYKIIDMPTMLSRNVKMQSLDDKDVWILDDNWYQQIRKIYEVFFQFLSINNLLRESSNFRFSDELVLFKSDLNQHGIALIQSGADERWLNAFDEPGGGPSPSDTSILENALKKIRGAKSGLRQ